MQGEATPISSPEARHALALSALGIAVLNGWILWVAGSCYSCSRRASRFASQSEPTRLIGSVSPPMKQ